MAGIRATRKATTSKSSKPTKEPNKLVSFQWEGSQYTIDLLRRKVYQNWMAIETNKGSAIIGAYRNTVAV